MNDNVDTSGPLGARGIDNSMTLKTDNYGFHGENEDLASTGEATRYLFKQGRESDISGYLLEIAASSLESDPRKWTESHVDKALGILDRLEEGDMVEDGGDVAEVINYVRI